MLLPHVTQLACNMCICLSFWLCLCIEHSQEGHTVTFSVPQFSYPRNSGMEGRLGGVIFPSNYAKGPIRKGYFQHMDSM